MNPGRRSRVCYINTNLGDWVMAAVLSRRCVVKVAVGLIACLAAQILLGCTQNDPQSHSRFDENAQSDHRELKTQKQFHFLYNPDYSRPDEFPPEIPCRRSLYIPSAAKGDGAGLWEHGLGGEELRINRFWVRDASSSVDAYAG